MDDREATGATRRGPAADRPAAPEDPLELVAARVPGDGEYAVRCLIEEYAGIGFDRARILALFRRPEYPVLHALYRRRGEAAVAELVQEVLAECGVWRFRDAHADNTAGRHTPVQIRLPACSEGD